jgi:iron(III) transport system ATP-binding protein
MNDAVGSIEVHNLRKTFEGGETVAVQDESFECDAGTITTLLGPSGCGKTTTLRCIAGLETPDSGKIDIGGTTVYNSDESLNTATENRDIGMMFQTYAVWPHLTVFDNVAFPLNIRQESDEYINERVTEVLELMDIGELADRYPNQLSGGQQQRVALARAIVYNPKSLLLDEPLSNLDARLRQRMRFELLKLQNELGLTTLYVTHSQDEAMVLSDRIIVMNQGRMIQRGAPEEIYADPANEFVADFIGESNILPIASYDSETKMVSVEGIDNQFKMMENGNPDSIVIRPEDIQVHDMDSGVDKDATNGFAGIVDTVFFLGDKWKIELDVGGNIIVCYTETEERFQAGSQVYCTVDPQDVNPVMK